MKTLTISKPIGSITHITGTIGAGKTTFIGDMLYNEQQKGKCAYLYTKREGNEHSGSWSVLPPDVLDPASNTECILLETLKDIEDLFKKWRSNPLQALGIDTSMGVELLIRTFITGGPDKELQSSLKDPQHKRFKNKLCDIIQDFRDVAKYTIMVSPATPTAYNPETAMYDKGASGSPIDAEKRFSPDGENQDSKLKLLYLSDYAFHIQMDEGHGTGLIKKRTLMMQPSLKYMTKARLPIGKQIENIILEPKVGVNWLKLKAQIEGTFA